MCNRGSHLVVLSNHNQDGRYFHSNVYFIIINESLMIIIVAILCLSCGIPAW